MSEYIYEMPGLGRYVFNDKGECKRTTYPFCSMKCYEGYDGGAGSKRFWKAVPHYHLLRDDNSYERVKLAEVKQYILHSQYIFEIFGVRF